MTRYHQPKELLNVALCMARKIMRLKKDMGDCLDDRLIQEEVDDLAAHAQQVLLEVEQRDSDVHRP